MGRLTETERTGMLNAHTNHWQQVNTEKGTLVLPIEPPYGIEQLKAQQRDYTEITQKIDTLQNATLSQLRAQRDNLFGVSAEDPNGVRGMLVQYKRAVRARLGASHPLSRVIPVVGIHSPQAYVPTLSRFCEHWGSVNQELAERKQGALTIGEWTHATLETKHKQLQTLQARISVIEESELPLLRAKREHLLGDVSEENRAQTSIIARLQLYQVEIKARFGQQPIAETLPRIFPESVASLPTFAYNWRQLSSGQVKTWLVLPKDAELIAQIYLQEGEFESSQPCVGRGQSVQTFLWEVTIAGEIDEIELRDKEQRTLYRGKISATLAEPA